MNRLRCLKILAEYVTNELVVCAIGPVSGEWHLVAPRPFNFLSSGMGTAGAVGLGVALGRPDRTVLVLHGDGGLLMSLGFLATAVGANPQNLKHLVFANGIYESSGGQALVNRNEVNWVALARGVGFRDAKEIRKEEEFLADLPSLLKNSGHAFRVLHVEPGSGEDVPPPDNIRGLKQNFREALAE